MDTRKNPNRNLTISAPANPAQQAFVIILQQSKQIIKEGFDFHGIIL